MGNHRRKLASVLLLVCLLEHLGSHCGEHDAGLHGLLVWSCEVFLKILFNVNLFNLHSQLSHRAGMWEGESSGQSDTVLQPLNIAMWIVEREEKLISQTKVIGFLTCITISGCSPQVTQDFFSIFFICNLSVKQILQPEWALLFASNSHLLSGGKWQH